MKEETNKQTNKQTKKQTNLTMTSTLRCNDPYPYPNTIQYNITFKTRVKKAFQQLLLIGN